jgi:hypothetical protein
MAGLPRVMLPERETEDKMHLISYEVFSGSDVVLKR